MDTQLNSENLTIEQSYKAMFVFLEGYYQRLGQPELLAVLLGGFRLRDNGYTVDPAAWEDWLEAVQVVQAEVDDNTNQ